MSSFNCSWHCQPNLSLQHIWSYPLPTISLPDFCVHWLVSLWEPGFLGRGGLAAIQPWEWYFILGLAAKLEACGLPRHLTSTMINAVVNNPFADVNMYLIFLDDHSRVILTPTQNEPDSHYINANYVDVSTQYCKWRIPVFFRKSMAYLLAFTMDFASYVFTFFKAVCFSGQTTATIHIAPSLQGSRF